MVKKEKTVQISYTTFIKAWAIFNNMIFSKEKYNKSYEDVKTELNDKLNKIINHQIFTHYKANATEEEKQKILDEYLNSLKDYL